jgi:hypothetical protein
VSEKTSEPDRALRLVADLVGANVNSLARTTDTIIEGLENEILSLAAHLLEVGEILDAASVIDRKTEYRLRAVDGYFEQAARIIERKRESQ